MIDAAAQDNTTRDEAPKGAKPARAWTDEEKVEYLAARQWSVSQIIRKTRLSRDRVNRILADLDEAKIRALAEGPESRRAWHTAYLEEVARQAFLSFNRSKRDGSKVGNPRLLRVGVEALSQVRKIHGDDAPERSAHLNINAHTLMDPDQQKVFLHDPVIRDAQLAIERRARELRGQGPDDVSGAVRRDREQGQMGLPAPPGTLEPPAGAGGDGGDPPPGHVHAAPVWEV
jgi:hypothetical protein